MAIFKTSASIGAPFLHDGGFVEHARHLHVLRSQIEIEEIIVKRVVSMRRLTVLASRLTVVSCATSLATAGLTAAGPAAPAGLPHRPRRRFSISGRVGQTWGVGHGRMNGNDEIRERCGLRPLAFAAPPSAIARLSAAFGDGTRRRRPKNTAANAATNAPMAGDDWNEPA